MFIDPETERDGRARDWVAGGPDRYGAVDAAVR